MRWLLFVGFVGDGANHVTVKVGEMAAEGESLQSFRKIRLDGAVGVLESDR